MSDRTKQILFKQIVIDGVYTNSYSIICPSCKEQSDVSGDVMDCAERDGEMMMPCCGKRESIYTKD